MRKLFLLLLVTFFAVGSYAADPWVKVSKKRITKDVYFLGGDQAQGRFPGTHGDTVSFTYITKELGKVKGMELLNGNGLQEFDYFRPGEGGARTVNCIGMIRAKNPTDEAIVIGAHFDHEGIKDGKTYYGADDNATGTSGVMELARTISKKRKHLKRNVIFVLFGAEDRGLFGSYYFCRNNPYPGQKIVYMLNMDMIGRVEEGKEVEFYGLGSGEGNGDFIKSIPVPEGIKAGYNDRVTGGSDHYPFYFIAKVPIFGAFTGIHPDYHKPGDTPDKINYDGMKLIIEYVGDIAKKLAVDGVTIPYKPTAKE